MDYFAPNVDTAWQYKAESSPWRESVSTDPERGPIARVEDKELTT